MVGTLQVTFHIVAISSDNQLAILVILLKSIDDDLPVVDFLLQMCDLLLSVLDGGLMGMDAFAQRLDDNLFAAAVVFTGTQFQGGPSDA